MLGGHYDLEARVKLALLTAVAAAAIALAAATASATSLRLAHKPFSQMTTHQKAAWLHKQAFHDRSIVRFWHNHPELVRIHRYKAHVQVHWARVSLSIVTKNLAKLAARHVAVSGGDMGSWLCIHRGEGAWDSIGYVNGTATYFGGLQEDIGFQKTYGSEFLSRYGTANNWPIIDQIIAARRARDGYAGYGARGYGPWPNTARNCGLL